MALKKIHIFFILPFLLFSCMESSEEVELESLDGVWMHEFSNEIETIKSTISFQLDGSYITENRRTQSTEGFNPGLMEAFKGKYSLKAGKITFSDIVYFYTKDYQNPPATIEGLQQQEMLKFSKQTVDVTFEENNQVMVLFYTCSDIELEEDDMVFECLEMSVEYTRVEKF